MSDVAPVLKTGDTFVVWGSSPLPSAIEIAGVGSPSSLLKSSGLMVSGSMPPVSATLYLAPCSPPFDATITAMCLR